MKIEITFEEAPLVPFGTYISPELAKRVRLAAAILELHQYEIVGASLEAFLAEKGL